MLTQPKHQFLARAEVTERAADGCHGVAVHPEECLWVVQPIADFDREDFAPVCGRRQSLTGEPPRLRELLTGHDEAILDPLNTCCLAARSGPRQAAGSLSMRVVRSCGVGVRHSGSNASCPWQLQPLLADRSAQSAEVFAEAPDGRLKLRDAAQQDWSAEIGAHARILSKSGQQSKYCKWRQLATADVTAAAISARADQVRPAPETGGASLEKVDSCRCYADNYP
jgi:hypothetical protein